MKQRSSVCLMKWLALMLASLLPLSGIAAEPVKGVQIPSAIDLTLSIHQQPKLHPELFDPVLGDRPRSSNGHGARSMRNASDCNRSRMVCLMVGCGWWG